MKKLAFFNQKNGLTPLEKCDFWDFQNFFFYSNKKVLFFVKHY